MGSVSKGSLLAGDRLLKPLWLAFALTCPLFAVEFLRFNNETLRIHVALPMVVLALILAVGCATLVAGALRGVDTGWRPAPETRWEWQLLAALSCFVAWHVVAWARAEAWVLPTREILKVAFGSFSVWGVLTFFPRDRRFHEQFWRIVLWTSALLVAVLVAEYAFVFRYPFLGNELAGVPNTYSIQLAWYLTPVMLHAAFYVSEAHRKWVAFLILFVFATGWLYIGSRAAWLAVGTGLLAVALRTRGRKLVSYAWPIGAAVTAGAVFLLAFVPAQLAFPRRALFLVSPGSVPELHTYEIRYGLAEATWGCFKASPLTGIGLGNTDRCIQFSTHNDYIAILSDLGIVGLSIFLTVLIIVGTKVLLGSQDESPSAWISHGSRASITAIAVILLFHNIYTATFFWLLLGLFCAEARSRGKAPAITDTACAVQRLGLP